MSDCEITCIIKCVNIYVCYPHVYANNIPYAHVDMSHWAARPGAESNILSCFDCKVQGGGRHHGMTKLFDASLIIQGPAWYAMKKSLHM